LLASPVRLPAGFYRAELVRGRRVYATGVVRGRRLRLHARGTVDRGRYALVLSGRRGRRAVIERVVIA
jgi:hypothetical protein